MQGSSKLAVLLSATYNATCFDNPNSRTYFHQKGACFSGSYEDYTQEALMYEDHPENNTPCACLEKYGLESGFVGQQCVV